MIKFRECDIREKVSLDDLLKETLNRGIEAYINDNGYLSILVSSLRCLVRVDINNSVIITQCIFNNDKYKPDFLLQRLNHINCNYYFVKVSLNEQLFTYEMTHRYNKFLDMEQWWDDLYFLIRIVNSFNNQI